MAIDPSFHNNKCIQAKASKIFYQTPITINNPKFNINPSHHNQRLDLSFSLLIFLFFSFLPSSPLSSVLVAQFLVIYYHPAWSVSYWWVWRSMRFRRRDWGWSSWTNKAGEWVSLRPVRIISQWRQYGRGTREQKKRTWWGTIHP